MKETATKDDEDHSYDTEKQFMASIAGNNQEVTASPNKKRRKVNSKKLNCLAKVVIKKIMKFPEYAIEAEENFEDRTLKTKLAKQLKENFNEHTKRYILLYVHIHNNHNHGDAPIQLQPKHKNVEHVMDKGCTRIAKQTAMPANFPRGVPVLKTWATLKGKNLMDLAMQFKSASELPSVLARPNTHQELENMSDQEMLSLYHNITEEIPNNMFSIANKEFTSRNLRLLLHLTIVLANAALDESKHQQVHPSVRIKGTEGNFTPAQCLDLDCPVIEAHMHCPFCARTDSYADTGLLKQHYMSKHVEKAIEFSGLKILRCYDVCEVVGRIDTTKTFTGGHWHCYKCANGLDKRNNAYDHYHSHLKNYESSFQIHVMQDVYPSTSGQTVPHEIQVSDYHWETYQSATNLNTISTTSAVSSSSPMKRSYEEAGFKDLETIDHTAVYVHEDESGNVTSTYTAHEIPTTGGDTYVITVPDGPELTQTKARVHELEIACRELEKENAVQKSHIEFLQEKDAEQSELIEQYKKEKQDLMLQIEDLKTQVESLKSAKVANQKSLGKSSGNLTMQHVSSVVNEQDISQGYSDFEQIHSNMEAYYDRAKKMEERLKAEKIRLEIEKNSSNIMPTPIHNYATRGAGVKYIAVKLSNDSLLKPCKAIIGKPQPFKEESTRIGVVSPGTPKIVEIRAEASSSHATAMEEMCKQLSSMRKDIELIKQAALGGSSGQVSSS